MLSTFCPNNSIQTKILQHQGMLKMLFILYIAPIPWNHPMTSRLFMGPADCGRAVGKISERMETKDDGGPKMVILNPQRND